MAKAWLTFFGLGAAAILLIGALGFVGNALGLGSYTFWAPKREAARRQVYEESASYVHGKRQYLSRLYGEWQTAEGPHRGVLCATARHEASTLDPEHLPSNLQTWECVK